MNWLVYEGDCLSTLQTHPGNYFDSMVTDPPAGVAFMHREWDSDRGGRDQWIDWLTTVMKECYRVLKPGAHCLVWALPRTSHWTATAIDNAGFEVRDIITHHYGSGFPKSQDISKFIEKLGTPEEILKMTRRAGKPMGVDHLLEELQECVAAFAGWGTALKPGSEHWILARKPLDQKTIARNVLAHGTGALNIDACRIDRAATDVPGWHKTGADGAKGYQGEDTFKIRAMTAEEIQERCGDKGRWPTNLLLSHSVACQQVGVRKVKANGNVSGKEPSDKTSSVYGKFEERESWQAHGDGDGTETVEVWECAEGCPIAEINRQSGTRPGCKTPSKAKCASIYRPDQGTYQGQGPIYGDTGGAARFFPNFHYFPKPGRKERDAGLAEMPDRTLNRVNPGGLENDPRWGPVQVKNDHPTVKAVSLMEWLIKLITPQDGVVLDPFCGSGSTGVAAVRSGFKFVGCELSAEYCKIANARITEANKTS